VSGAPASNVPIGDIVAVSGYTQSSMEAVLPSDPRRDAAAPRIYTAHEHVTRQTEMELPPIVRAIDADTIKEPSHLVTLHALATRELESLGEVAVPHSAIVSCFGPVVSLSDC
jgi:hypothetical protein